MRWEEKGVLRGFVKGEQIKFSFGFQKEDLSDFSCDFSNIFNISKKFKRRNLHTRFLIRSIYIQSKFSTNEILKSLNKVWMFWLFFAYAEFFFSPVLIWEAISKWFYVVSNFIGGLKHLLGVKRDNDTKRTIQVTGLRTIWLD